MRPCSTAVHNREVWHQVTPAPHACLNLPLLSHRMIAQQQLRCSRTASPLTRRVPSRVPAAAAACKPRSSILGQAAVGAGALAPDQGYIQPDATLRLPDLKGVRCSCMFARHKMRCFVWYISGACSIHGHQQPPNPHTKASTQHLLDDACDVYGSMCLSMWHVNCGQLYCW
jgi:hypothetical protein